MQAKMSSVSDFKQIELRLLSLAELTMPRHCGTHHSDFGLMMQDRITTCFEGFIKIGILFTMPDAWDDRISVSPNQLNTFLPGSVDSTFAVLCQAGQDP